jgi:hypothetical protein
MIQVAPPNARKIGIGEQVTNLGEVVGGRADVRIQEGDRHAAPHGRHRPQLIAGGTQPEVLGVGMDVETCLLQTLPRAIPAPVVDREQSAGPGIKGRYRRSKTRDLLTIGGHRHSNYAGVEAHQAATP